MSDLNFSLLPWQQEVFTDTTRFKVIAAGRRCGKSRLAATTLIIEGLRCPPGSAVLYVSPTMGQSRQIIWDLLLELGREVIQGSHVNNLDITLINGARIYVRGADRPDTLRGVSLTYAVLDEVADIKPEAWEQVIRASLSDKKGRAMFIGTPKGRNWFYDLWNLGQDEKDKDWKSWHFTTADNPLIDPDEIESAKKTLSTFSFKQEYMASFSNAGADVFKEEWIKYGVEPEHGSYFVAIDLAGFEEVAKQAANAKKRLDESAICVVKVTDDGKWFVKEIEHGRWDIRETAAKILMKMRDYRPLSVGIERGALKNAVLPYLSDLMRKSNVYSHIVDLTHGNRKKTDRIIWSLQGRFEHGRVILNSEEKWDDFVDQLLMFPSQGVHDDLCFPAETKILTANGEKPIFEVTTDDYVVTRQGLKKVLKAWCKGTKTVITRYGISATPEHLIFTVNKGWVRLDSLNDDDTIVVSTIKETSCENHLSLMGEHITDTQTQSNLVTGGTSPRIPNGKKIQGHYTETFGNSIMGQYQMDTMSITLTEIVQTTLSQISNAYPLLHTKSNTQQSEVCAGKHQSDLSILQESEILQKHGTVAQKGLPGTKNTQNEVLGKICQTNVVLSAERLSSRKSQYNSCVEMSGAITSDKPELQERNVPVYDLMVEGCHEFFANGVLAHNCDALSYMDQLAVTSYFEEADDEWEPMDIIAGI